MSGFDPSTVVRVTPIAAMVSVEDQDETGLCTGDRFIWARHETRPHLDALLVTVHYNYAYLDNSTIGGVAESIAKLFTARDRDATLAETTSAPAEGSQPGPTSASPENSSEHRP